MKKHRIAAALAAIMMTLCCAGSPVAAHAQTASDPSAYIVERSAADDKLVTSSDGLYTYTLLDDGTAKIVYYCPTRYPEKFSGKDISKVVLPGEVDGHKVTVIGGIIFGVNDDQVGAIKEVVVPDTVTSLEATAFRKLVNLKKITLSKNLKSIGEQAFYETGLETITLPDSLTEIGEQCFGESALTSVSIPASVKTLGNGVFWECKKLTNVDLSACTAELPQQMFRGCESLESISVPASVPSVGAFVFSGCIKLKKASVYSPVIGRSIFMDCDAIAEVYFGDTVVEIEDFNYFYIKEAAIYCYRGTYAESYLSSHKVAYNYIYAEGSGPLLGDVDFNNSIESGDALSVLRHSTHLEDFNENQKRVADVDSNGTIDSSDALDILRYSVNLGGNAKIGRPV